MTRIVVAVLLCAAALFAAPTTRADGVLDAAEDSWVQVYGNPVVCATLDDYPSEAGVAALVQIVVNHGFSTDNSVDIINAAVWLWCPRHWALLEAIGAKYRGEKMRAI